MDKRVISPYMEEQNRLFHKQRADYGTFGAKWTKAVSELYKTTGSASIIDYGAGKRTLEKSLALPVQSYDPGIEEISALPSPADLLVCTHVLEHIEPDLLDNVLDHIKELTKKAFLIGINAGESNKFLPDGRDSNLIQKPMSWWYTVLKTKFPDFKIMNINRPKFIRAGQIIQEESNTRGTFIGTKI